MGISRGILLVGDDPDLHAVAREAVRSDEYRVVVAEDGAAAAAAALDGGGLALLVIDLAPTAGDAVALARTLKDMSGLPAVLIVGPDAELGRIAAAGLAGEEFLSKPFSPGEMRARIRTALRRQPTGRGGLLPGAHPSPEIAGSIALQGSPAPRAAPEADSGRRYRFAGWTLEPRSRRLTGPGGSDIALTAGEQAVLLAFLEAPGRVLSREQLLGRYHGTGGGLLDRSVDVQVLRLRRKIEPDEKAPTLIRTERGAGYVFTPAVEVQE